MFVSKGLYNPSNYQTLFATLTLLQFPLYGWVIEKLAPKNRKVSRIVHTK